MFESKNVEVHYSANDTPLSVIHFSELPFQPVRIYWISSFPTSEPRGFHAHKRLNQALAVVSGSIRLRLCRGEVYSELILQSNDKLLFIPKGTWREIYALEDDTTIVVLADQNFDEEDYLRNWVEYLDWYRENEIT